MKKLIGTINMRTGKFSPIDPNTGRPYGDHGTATDAINYALSRETGGDAATFLYCWREGNLDEWPEYYGWLRKQGL